MSEQSTFGIIVSFPDASASFTLGFEAGMIWERMQRIRSPFERTVHTDNREVIERMALAADFEVVIVRGHSPLSEWSTASFAPRDSVPRFRVINGGLTK